MLSHPDLNLAAMPPLHPAPSGIAPSFDICRVHCLRSFGAGRVEAKGLVDHRHILATAGEAVGAAPRRGTNVFHHLGVDGRSTWVELDG